MVFSFILLVYHGALPGYRSGRPALYRIGRPAETTAARNYLVLAKITVSKVKTVFSPEIICNTP